MSYNQKNFAEHAQFTAMNQLVQIMTEAVQDVAKARWGDVPISTEVTVWEDYDFQIDVWHTFWSDIDSSESGRVALYYTPRVPYIKEEVRHVQRSMSWTNEFEAKLGEEELIEMEV